MGGMERAEYPPVRICATPARGLLVLVLAGCSSGSPLEGKSVADWEKLLREGDATARAQAGLGLSKLGPAAAPAMPALMDALKDDKPLVRQNAAVALCAIGPEARAAIPALIAALSDSEWTVRRQSALALGAIGADPRSVAALRKAAGDANSLVQKAAKEALKQVGG